MESTKIPLTCWLLQRCIPLILRTLDYSSKYPTRSGDFGVLPNKYLPNQFFLFAENRKTSDIQTTVPGVLLTLLFYQIFMSICECSNNKLHIYQ